MAKQKHLDILKKGVKKWNQWRQEHPDIEPDLSAANLRKAKLSGARLWRTDLRESDLSRADLSAAYLREANLSAADLSRADLSSATLNGANLSEADLSGADLSGAKLLNINLRRAHLSRANLNEADLFGAYLSWADFSDANLSGTILFGAYLREANLSRANLSGADARRANFFWPDIRASFTPGSHGPMYSYDESAPTPSGANLSGANLSGANLSGADLSAADLSAANLRKTNFSWANLSGANLSRADLTGCFVYATSAWDVLLTETVQANLIITDPDKSDEPVITVDNLEVAQFIYLLLNNERIRYVIDTITSKAVLILGRFSDERKMVLDAIKDELRKYDYLPILFDFEPPKNRDLTETVGTLARISRFIIAEMTDPRSIPQELYSIVPFLPNVPVQPLLEASQKEYALFETFKAYPWVLPIYHYPDLTSLLASLKENIIEPAEQKAQELEKR